MKTNIGTTLVGLALPALFAFALRPVQEQALPARITPPEHFEALAPLVGRTWRATFPDGKHHDTQEFEWMFGGKFIRNVHRVTSLEGELVYEGETIYGWDHDRKCVRWWYFNATGGQVIGDLSEQDGRLVAEGDNHAPKGQAARVRSEMVLEDELWYSISYFLVGGEWQEQHAMEFKPVE